MAADICSDHPSAFWDRKKHIVTLPYEDNFSENDIPTKSRSCQMNAELVDFCKKEIDNLIQKGLIKPSKSPWSCTAFYVNEVAEQERGVPSMGGNDPPPWSQARGRGGKNRGRGRSTSQSSQRSSYDSSFPIILGNKGHVNSKIDEASSSSSTINLKDICRYNIPTNSPLYQQLQAYLQTKEQGDTYASLAKEGDMQKCSEKATAKEIIFLLENSDIQRSNEPWKIF
ncbi:uncharacterized protein LOC107022336 [Solanum pennellii]|uniref:Uncharacterized protein LOC107022336 n=1 Tax=Solanum pennellii TaxID=28526 RepID=A0ABM1H031_SOLPN|nr:uncharacterized protein LOC107022336 [Solanum pennellii]